MSLSGGGGGGGGAGVGEWVEGTKTKVCKRQQQTPFSTFPEETLLDQGCQHKIKQDTHTAADTKYKDLKLS